MRYSPYKLRLPTGCTVTSRGDQTRATIELASCMESDVVYLTFPVNGWFAARWETQLRIAIEICPRTVTIISGDD